MNTPNPFPAFSRPNSNIVKAGNKGTLCVLILDESGSMANFQSDTIGGVNSFIENQKRDKDDTRISIVKFEGGNVRIPFNNVPVEEMPALTHKDYSPLGMTNLLDAIGVTVQRINSEIQNLPESERPSVMIQVMTDGHENASREYTKDRVKALVEDTQANDWIFTFVGANIDSITTSTSLGFNAAATSNYSTSKTGDTYAVLSESVTRMKSMRSAGLSNQEIYASGAIYTAEDKAKIGG